MEIEKVFNNNIYTLTDEKPNNHDKVLTDDYGVWEFFNESDCTAPLPYWANHHACKKIVAVNGVKIEDLPINSPLL